MQEHELETYLGLLEETLALVSERAETTSKLPHIRNEEERAVQLRRLREIGDTIAENSMQIDKFQKIIKK